MKIRCELLLDKEVSVQIFEKAIAAGFDNFTYQTASDGPVYKLELDLIQSKSGATNGVIINKREVPREPKV